MQSFCSFHRALAAVVWLLAGIALPLQAAPEAASPVPAASGRAAPVPAAPVRVASVHAASGIAFPEVVGAFKYIGARHFEAQHPGLGSAYGYRSGFGTTATVYVYTAGLKDIPTSVDHPSMSRLREQTKNEIRQHGQSRGALVHQSHDGALPIKLNNGSEVRVLFDRFEFIHGNGDNEDNMLWLWTARGHVVKIRMSDNRSTEQSLDFVKAVLALSQ
ncbi:MAG: hypothetical protein H6R01_1462 [Burkholderiaceae bacterium]|nr:hypothetical protein [Burkholderiaceae bacterium]